MDLWKLRNAVLTSTHYKAKAWNGHMKKIKTLKIKMISAVSALKNALRK